MRRGGRWSSVARLKVPFLGSIPINVAIRKSGDEGNPAEIFDKDPQGGGAAVQKVMENLAWQISIRNETRPAPVELSIHR